MHERDPVINAVRSDLTFWSRLYREHGGLDRPAVPTRDWIRHAYEEAVRTAIFLKRILMDMEAIPEADVDADADARRLACSDRQMSLWTQTPAVPEMPHCLALEVDLRCVRFRGGGRLRLSGKEYEFLSILVEHAGKVVRKETLVRLVWGLADPPLSADNAVGVYIHRIRSKLAGHASIVSIRDVGYCLFYKDDPNGSRDSRN